MRRKLDHRLHLSPVESVEPFHDVVYTRARFKIFKDSGNGHTRILQDPGAADFARHTLNGRALRPIDRFVPLEKSILMVVMGLRASFSTHINEPARWRG